jgi:hypothetical protein
MTKAETRQRLSNVASLIDHVFKRSTEDLLREVQTDWPGVTLTEFKRDELLPILIKGYVFAAFDRDKQVK